MLTSMVCRYDHFLTGWFAKWATAFRGHAGLPGGSSDLWPAHRKAWEWCSIMQALDERGLLRPGRSGCGFAVGTEPLPSLMAAHGADVLATDRPVDDGAKAWAATNQHATSLASLYVPALVDEAAFGSRVTFQPKDMLDLQLPWDRTFDFVWSSCSLEHLGNLENGLQFVLNSTKLLKPGGFALHTTEYNVSSNDETLAEGPAVIYRRRDFEELDRRLRLASCAMAPFDAEAGDHQFDIEYDIPPYSENGRPHVKLMLDGHIATSALLIIRKGREAQDR